MVNDVSHRVTEISCLSLPPVAQLGAPIVLYTHTTIAKFMLGLWWASLSGLFASCLRPLNALFIKLSGILFENVNLLFPCLKSADSSPLSTGRRSPNSLVWVTRFQRPHGHNPTYLILGPLPLVPLSYDHSALPVCFWVRPAFPASMSSYRRYPLLGRPSSTISS